MGYALYQIYKNREQKMKPEFHKPIYPWRVTQAWGILNPIYKRFGWEKHNGVDIALGVNAEIHAPFDGQVVRMGNQPQGGGIFLGFLSKNFYDFPDGVRCRVLFDFLHLSRTIAVENGVYGVGDLLAYADNTGFSTGPHTHIQCRRVKYENGQLIVLDRNDANNSFDTEPYWSGIYAKDFGTLRGQLALITQLLTNLLLRIRK